MKIRKIKVLSFKKNVAQLSNGELLTAILKDDTDFLIQATTLSGDLLPYVRLEGRFQKNQQFYLRLISNEEFVSSNFKKNRHNGVGIILMRLLLTFIADYNKHVEEYKQVKFITGSIVSLGSTDIDYLRAFYRKMDKLTDFENTIRIEMNHEEHEKNSLLALDEFASLGINEELILAALRRFRKRKCRLLLLTQSLVDFNLLYGSEVTKAILANINFKILLGNLNESESRHYFAELLGTIEKEKRSISKNSKSTTRTIAEEKQYIIDPTEMDKQGKDTVILIGVDGFMKLKKNYYFKK